ncbi:hypothetical protein CEG14_10070 [Bordetella genomosp. 1]|uniref:DUF2188 domain-containing protein n=1 Tax=Bordetella genomosp. 1 TaxID=1395607 RepID=A0A261SF38_9BORD|nr:hypothetical protein [Bordetella genomosp. 1]OZI35430.1 hypothetical protein CEG14_10070 [Bordetella genomosp. 1]OZI63970.1 hypothetical protein CAL27_15385 [Bordetella genomosp. 1]
MIVEVFQHTDGQWSFRSIATLGVQEDRGRYPTAEAARDAARIAWPDQSPHIVAPEDDPSRRLPPG